ncbi:MAG TPA: hypothetical protein VEB86_07215 [Chryseosolibacter sp.]|nr:hypothetical protein [Chryseosolibacter sp.]
MKKFVIVVVVLFAAAAAGAFVFYKVYLPELVASAIVNDQEPGYMPDYVQTKIRKYRTPVNQAAEDVIRHADRSNISMDQILRTIDNTKEEHVNAALAELSDRDVKNTNQVFDIFKKHIPADFDVEPLREPFNDHVSMKMIHDALERSRQQLDKENLDADMAKAVIKQVLVQKEAEYRRRTNAN